MKKFSFPIEQATTAINLFLSRYYYVCALLLVVIIGAIAWLFFLQEEYFHIRESGILGYEKTVQQLEERQSHLDELRLLESEYAGLHQERLRQLSALLPQGIDSAQIITNMHAFAESADVNILSIDVVGIPTKAKNTDTQDTSAAEAKKKKTTAQDDLLFENKHIRMATIALNVESQQQATYEGVKQFLNALESFTPVLDLHSLTYSPDTSSFALQLRTYYFDPELIQP